MLLLYHKVDIITPSRWWVGVDSFALQIEKLRKTRTLTYLDDYDPENPKHVVITFDDAYENVYRHAFPQLRKREIPFELFISNDLIGRWNHFDSDELLTRFCSEDQLLEMAGYGGRLQWHTKSHRYLPGLDKESLERELTIFPELSRKFPSPHFRWFAYPYGSFDDAAVSEVRQRFAGAVSVEQGNSTDRFMLNRFVAENDWVPD